KLPRPAHHACRARAHEHVVADRPYAIRFPVCAGPGRAHHDHEVAAPLDRRVGRACGSRYNRTLSRILGHPRMPAPEVAETEHPAQTIAEEHPAFVKTPQQLVLLIVAAFVVPVTVIVMLVVLVSSLSPYDKSHPAMTDEAI